MLILLSMNERSAGPHKRKDRGLKSRKYQTNFEAGRRASYFFRIGAPFDMGIRIDRVVVLRGYPSEAEGCGPFILAQLFGEA
jgi:hypothetical protein